MHWMTGMTGGFWVVFETQNYCFGSVLGSRIIVLGLLVRFCRFFCLFRLKSTYIRYFLDDFSGTCSILGRFFGRFVSHKLLFWVMLQGPPPITPDIFPIESPPRGSVASRFGRTFFVCGVVPVNNGYGSVNNSIIYE